MHACTGQHINSPSKSMQISFIFLYLFGVLRHFQHCTGHITTGSWNGRGNQYIEFSRVLYCKLPTNGKQLPAFPHKAFTGIEPQPQRWEARVLPLCHCGPFHISISTQPVYEYQGQPLGKVHVVYFLIQYCLCYKSCFQVRPKKLQDICFLNVTLAVSYKYQLYKFAVLT